ncbi:MAG: hypothetical protein GQ574_15380 [Crocinitomix sp.]|nr:hypothetical protein [Crocinitomix sp.]
MTRIVRLFKGLTPYDHFLTFLLILTVMKIVNVFVVAGKTEGVQFALLGLGLIALSTLIFFLLKKFVDQKKTYKNTLISVLIIVLILSHADPEPIRGILVILLLFVSKFFIKHKKRNIFNPVIFSVAVVTLISFIIPAIGVPPVDWTGIDIRFPILGNEVALPIIPIILALTFNVGRMKRHPIALTFIIISLAIAYGFNFYGTTFLSYAISILFVGAAIIVEPKTSPTKFPLQFYYGAATAIGIALLSLAAIPNAIILGLFLSNIVFFVHSQMMKKKVGVVKSKK